MIYFWMILWVGLGFSAPPPEEEAETLLRNAKTWYYVARLTENSLKAHKRSEGLYKKTLEILKDTQSKKGKELQEQAQLGLDQTVPRIDNAHDTFRNVLWPVWWITESDPTAEWYDDLFMKAAELCWDNIEHQLDRFKRPTRTPVITRAFRNPALPEKSLIDEMSITDRTQLLRDELLIYADYSDNVYALTDDYGRSLIGKDWNDLIFRDDVPKEALQNLGSKLKSRYIMIIDMNIVDEIPRETNHTPIVRLDTQAYLVNTATGVVDHHIYVQGIGKDLRSQNASALWWVIGVFFITTIVTITQLSLDEEDHDIHVLGILGVALASFLIGGALGEFAGDVSAEYLQNWGTPSYVREYAHFTIPYFPVLIWPFIHGFVVLIGPLIILAWLSNKLRDLIDTFIENPKSHLLIIAPSAQAGAATWMFHPLIEGVPDNGVYISAILTFSAVLCSYSIVRPLSEVIEGKNINRPNLLALLFGALGLSVLLPFGFYHDNATWACLFVMVCVICSRYHQKRVRTIEPTVQAEDQTLNIEFEKIGSLEKPLWLPLIDIDIIKQIEQKFHINIQAQSQYGASRTIQEYTKKLHQAEKRLIRIVVDEKNSSRPFSLIKDISESLGLNLDLEHQTNIGSTLQGGMSQAGAMLSFFPALNLIVDSVSGRESDENFTRSRIIEEGAKYLIQAFETNGTEAIVLEDLHNADPSSMEVLTRYMALAKSPPSLVWNSLLSKNEILTAHEQIMSDFHNTVEDCHTLTTCIIPKLDLEKAVQFLKNTRVIGLKEEIILSLISSSGYSIGRFQVLLLLMLERGLLIKTVQEQEDDSITYYTAKTNLKERELWELLPKDIQEQELLRLAHLDRDTKFIIECAALCGQTFTVDELVSGCGIPEQKVLLQLEQIESIQPSIIEDISDVDKEFRFLNQMTRIALIDSLSTSSSGPLRELAKSVHRGVLIAHAKKPFLHTHEVIHHTANLSTYEELLCTSIRKQLLSYQKQCAWPEIIGVFEQYEERVFSSAEVEVHFDISIVAAKAYRFTGGQKNRDRMFFILNGLIAQYEQTLSSMNTFRLFSLFFTLCEGLFEERDADDMKTLIELCEHHESKSYPTQIHAIFEFYREFAVSFLNRNSPIVPQLKQILERLETVSKKDSYEYKMLYSSIFQTYANKYWHENQLPRETPKEENQRHQQQLFPTWIALMEQALTKKQEIQDVQGIAMNYGIRGGCYLFTMKDGAKALECFERDWDVVEENNMSDQKPGLLNKIAMSHILLAQSSAQKQKHIQDAKKLALESLTMAEKMERESDFAFTIGTILRIIVDNNDAKLAQYLAKKEGWLLCEEYWGKRFPAFLKSGTHKTLTDIRDRNLCSSEPWFLLALKHTAPES